MVDVYALTPIDRTAGTVTSQKGVAQDEQLTSQQKHENLISKVRSLEKEVILYKKGTAKRIEIGKEIHKTHERIRKLKPDGRVENLEHFIIEVIKSGMSEFQWKNTVKQAVILQKKNKPPVKAI